MMIGDAAWAASALGLVLALVWLAQFATRRGVLPRSLVQRGGAARDLAILDVVALDARRRVHLIRCADRRLVVLTGGPTDLLLATLPDNGS